MRGMIIRDEQQDVWPGWMFPSRGGRGKEGWMDTWQTDNLADADWKEIGRR